MRRYATTLAWLQGAYYVITGVWPLVSLASFMAVTGPKTDTWLVQTFGVLVAVVGGVLILAARRRAVDGQTALLAAGVALALSVCDVIFVSLHSISAVYLLDAIPEVALVVLWGLAARREKGH
ncbi:MAG: hypothetical protein QOE90_2823 [Thermoplasmata archaeon]|nr:hypothetical protein [Thermoplasmata archaeon]